MSFIPAISLYTHKGGVSKTTNCMHVSWALAKYFGKRVLIIDADPQCNITQLLIPESRDDPDFFFKTKFTDIFQVLSPVMHGKSKTLTSVQPLQVRPQECSKNGKGGLFLIPGNLKLSTFEPIIALAHSLSTSGSYPIFDSIPGLFREAIKQSAEACSADLVFVDMGPSIGELNKNIFFSLDYFLLPTTADVYCKSTITTMKKTLSEWASNHAVVSNATKNHSYSVKKALPKFLGSVISMFNVAGKEGKPVKQSQTWIDLIKLRVENELSTVLMEKRMMHEVQVEGFCVAEIPNFLSLLPISQRAAYPVFDIPSNRFEVFDENKGEFKPMTRAEIESNSNRAKVFERIFKEFASTMLKQINKEE